MTPTAVFHFGHRRRPNARVLVHNHPPYGTFAAYGRREMDADPGVCDE